MHLFLQLLNLGHACVTNVDLSTLVSAIPNVQVLCGKLSGLGRM